MDTRVSQALKTMLGTGPSAERSSGLRSLRASLPRPPPQSRQSPTASRSMLRRRKSRSSPARGIQRGHWETARRQACPPGPKVDLLQPVAVSSQTIDMMRDAPTDAWRMECVALEHVHGGLAPGVPSQDRECN